MRNFLLLALNDLFMRYVFCANFDTVFLKFSPVVRSLEMKKPRCFWRSVVGITLPLRLTLESLNLHPPPVKIIWLDLCSDTSACVFIHHLSIFCRSAWSEATSSGVRRGWMRTKSSINTYVEALRPSRMLEKAAV